MRTSPLVGAHSWATLPPVAGDFPWRTIPLLIVALASTAFAADPTPKLAATDIEFFETRIRPVLVERCYDCHSRSAERVKAGLLLDTREGMLRGSNSGDVLVPGDPESSLLIEAIRYVDEDLQMPPSKNGGKLSDQQIADFEEWVRRGAPDPRTEAAVAEAKSYGGAGKAHWAFQPVEKPGVPAVQNTAWAYSPIDHFVLSKLEAAGLQPNPEADKRTLLRRVTFDLIGLPPTDAEIQAFVADTSPTAFEKVVDRLLASPAYGERWARYWLDVARYSDTKGDPPGRQDSRFPHAWTYRDYLIEAFNTDKPYNQFILEQLAADRLVLAKQAAAKARGNPTPDQRELAAMGFLTLGNQFNGRRDDIIADRIDVTTKAFLGLTVACARCHDHKFDPIPTKDYYSLYSVFANSVDPANVTVQPTLTIRLPKTSELEDYLTKIAELQKQDDEIKAKYIEVRKGDRPPSDRRELQREDIQVQRQIGQLESTHPGVPPKANLITDAQRIRDYTVLIRGEPGNKGETVPRRFLEALSPDPKNRPEWKRGSGRLELAQAIADPKNPMTARVFVNRIWQQHFGEGFVGTPDDLGNMSNPPTHPELLDWLATEFVEAGWSIKLLHRAIVLSHTYRQSSAPNPDAQAVDPNNLLFWRYNLHRLDFEELYDSLLAIAGTLDLTIGGRSISTSSETFGNRRSLYTLVDRGNPPDLLTQFDFPNPDVSSGKRYDTTVPQQALFLMNSPLVIETARSLTHRQEFIALKDDRDRVVALYLAIFQRPPTDPEIKLAVDYVRANPQGQSLDLPAPSQPSTREKVLERQRALKKAAAGRYERNDQRPIGADIAYGGVEDAWTKLAHALFQANEAMFVN